MTPRPVQPIPLAQQHAKREVVLEAAAVCVRPINGAGECYKLG